MKDFYKKSINIKGSSKQSLSPAPTLELNKLKEEFL
jgi:hypothetical protein